MRLKTGYHQRVVGGLSQHEGHAGQPRKLRTDAAEAALIRDLATDSHKRELFTKLADHLAMLAAEVERAIATQADR